MFAHDALQKQISMVLLNRAETTAYIVVTSAKTGLTTMPRLNNPEEAVRQTKGA